MRSVTGIADPREAEHPPDAEWCHEHGILRESCGPCLDADIQRASFERELDTNEAYDAMGRALRAMLDRINDETMGAALAARFEGRK